MIIFYDRTTGEIIGNVEGRVHTPEQEKIFIGDPKTTEKLVINWNPVKWYNQKGEEVERDAIGENGERIAVQADFEPLHDQKDLFVDFELGKEKIMDYKMDLKTKTLVKKNG